MKSAPSGADSGGASAATVASGLLESSAGPGNSAMFPFLGFRGLVFAIVSTYFPTFSCTLAALFGHFRGFLKAPHYYSITVTPPVAAFKL